MKQSRVLGVRNYMFCHTTQLILGGKVALSFPNLLLDHHSSEAGQEKFLYFWCIQLDFHITKYNKQEHNIRQSYTYYRQLHREPPLPELQEAEPPSTPSILIRRQPGCGDPGAGAGVHEEQEVQIDGRAQAPDEVSCACTKDAASSASWGNNQISCCGKHGDSLNEEIALTECSVPGCGQI